MLGVVRNWICEMGREQYSSGGTASHYILVHGQPKEETYLDVALVATTVFGPAIEFGNGMSMANQM